MVEHTQPAGYAIEIRRAASPGQSVSYAGSDIARRGAAARRHLIGSREIGMLAACGIAQVSIARRPRRHLSTGGELVQPGAPFAPPRDRHQWRDCLGGNHGEWRRADFLGAIADDEQQLEAAMRRRSKIPGHAGAVGRHLEGRQRRLSPHHRAPRKTRHHRPWRGAETGQAAMSCRVRRQAGGDPARISTSAMFTFHDMIVPVLRHRQ